MLVGLTGGLSAGSSTSGEIRSRFRNGIGSAGAPAATIGPEIDALHHGRGIVTRPDHHRQPQRELVSCLLDRLLIFDLHQHGFAGADIGDRIGEDVRPLLLGQRRLLPRCARRFIDDAGLLPLLDVADDDAIADHHLQRVDRAARRQRIDVSSLDPVLRRVAEDLRDAGANRGAGYGEIDIDAEPRGVGVAILSLQQQRAGADVGGLDQGWLQARRPHRLEAQK
jgi:hypothetical protein